MEKLTENMIRFEERNKMIIQDCEPEHRGRGVYKNLLNYAINTLKTEGYTRLGVDFESINPSGSGFWLKYFNAYTKSVVRRIDERIIQRVSLE